MDPIGQSAVTQLGIGGALAVIIAYVMVHVFKLFIAHWNKQETDRTEAYKVSAQAHAASLGKMAEQMERLTVTIGERVADALSDVRLAITRLESKFDAALDWQERTPIETRIPPQPIPGDRRASSIQSAQAAQAAVQSGFGPGFGARRAKSEPSDR
jgi:hypothetical protein